MEKPSVRNRLRSIAKYGPNMQLHAEKHFQIPHASDGHGAFLDGANACRGPHKPLTPPVLFSLHFNYYVLSGLCRVQFVSAPLFRWWELSWRHLRGPASSIALAEVMATARRTEAKAEARAAVKQILWLKVASIPHLVLDLDGSAKG